MMLACLMAAPNVSATTQTPAPEQTNYFKRAKAWIKAHPWLTLTGGLMVGIGIKKCCDAYASKAKKTELGQASIQVEKAIKKDNTIKEDNDTYVAEAKKYEQDQAAIQFERDIQEEMNLKELKAAYYTLSPEQKAECDILEKEVKQRIVTEGKEIKALWAKVENITNNNKKIRQQIDLLEQETSEELSFEAYLEILKKMLAIVDLTSMDKKHLFYLIKKREIRIELELFQVPMPFFY